MTEVTPPPSPPEAGGRRALRTAILVALVLAIALLMSLCTRVTDQVEMLSCLDSARRDVATITGYVATLDATPIEGATVEIVGADAATSDATGRFTLNDLPPGAHRLHVEAEGFRELDAAIELPGCDSGVNIVLRTDGAPFFGPVFGPYL